MLVILYNPNLDAKECSLIIREVRRNSFLWKSLQNSLEPVHLHFSLPLQSFEIFIKQSHDTTVDVPESTFLYYKGLSHLARGQTVQCLSE